MAILTPIDQAVAAVVGDCQPLQASELLPLAGALGRVCAASCVAAIDVPPADNSAMDGYAIRYADLAVCPEGLSLTQRIAAGQTGQPLQPGTAARIFTGAEIPLGADTVLLQEEVDSAGGRLVSTAPVKRGQHIRPRGQDLACGATVVDAGKPLQPADLALLASVGVDTVAVRPRPRIGLLSSGDELVEPGQPLAPGQIYNSNRIMLAALLDRLGCECVDAGNVADSLDSTCAQLTALVDQKLDLIITTGGVSVGEEDHVKAAIEQLGHLQLWKLNIKPGKPLAYGRVSGVPLVALPGNPSSALVTFALVVVPWLRKLLGVEPLVPVPLRLPAGFSVDRAGRRQEYLRVRVGSAANGEPRVIRYPNQSSGVLASVAWANALAVIPPDTLVEEGDPVAVLPFSVLLQL